MVLNSICEYIMRYKMFGKWVIILSIGICGCAELSHKMLSSGEDLVLNLENYFQHGSDVELNKNKSSEGWEKIVEINGSNSPLQFKMETQMMANISGNQTIYLSQYTVLQTKTFYNQPIKLFLLQGNLLMMYLYKSHTQSLSNKVLALDLNHQTAHDTWNCNDMETQQDGNRSILYVICSEDFTHIVRFYVVSVLMLMDDRGYIDDFVVDGQHEVDNSSTCRERKLQYFSKLQANQTILSYHILAYCSQVIDDGRPTTLAFFKPSNLFYISYSQIQRCLLGASYVSITQNGFLSILGKELYQYYGSINNGSFITRCSCINEDFNYIFATSRINNDIYFSYFFMEDNRILIKTSYRVNSQELKINISEEYEISSYAMTERIMGVSLTNGTHMVMIVYSLDSLYPRQIDTVQFQGTQDAAVYQLLSVSNYLERSFYFFTFDPINNLLIMYVYKGYETRIRVKEDISRPLPDTLLTLLFESHDEQLQVNITIRDRDEESLWINYDRRQQTELKITSQIQTINLTENILGPLQRFYPNTTKNAHLHLLYINSYNFINISEHLSHTILIDGKLEVQFLRYMAINHQLKMADPIVYLLYSSYMYTCTFTYRHHYFDFFIDCNKEQHPPTMLSTSIKNNITDTIILDSDLWLQYNQFVLQLCSIVGSTGKCELLDLSSVGLDSKEPINNIRLVSFDVTTTGHTNIELFFMTDNRLFYGQYEKQSIKKGEGFTYKCYFIIGGEEVPQLRTMQLKDIHFDHQYKTFLILYLQNTTMHRVLVFDRPAMSPNSIHFVGHLIGQLPLTGIETVLFVHGLIIIIGSKSISEHEITEKYNVVKNRQYPLYRYEVTRNGTHKSDNKFIYVESKNPVLQTPIYLVYCPTLSTTNILTHTIPKGKGLKFIKEIGRAELEYQYSLAINGDSLHSLALPNLLLEFNSTTQRSKCSGCSDGNFTLVLLDPESVFHQLTYTYKFDNSNEEITYKGPQQMNITMESKEYRYSVNVSQIEGPVMNYQLSIPDECPFLSQHPEEMDVFTKERCLLDYNTYQYGGLLDFLTINSLELIVTNWNLICVEGKKIRKILKMGSQAKTCSIINHENSQIFILCDQGAKTAIMFIQELSNCYDLTYENISQPPWLTYQYFNLKTAEDFILFQVPIREYFNKIYYLCQFNEHTHQFLPDHVSLVQGKKDNFLARDYDIDENYVYILQESGLVIYDNSQLYRMVSRQEERVIQPVCRVSKQQFESIIDEGQIELVYVKAEMDFGINGTNKVFIELGTKKEAYKMTILFDDEQRELVEAKVLLVYRQYKNCENDVGSRSQQWGQMFLKICTWEAHQQCIFSNFYPITPTGKIKYVQFYRYESENSGYYPFRMEEINANTNVSDTFQINQQTGQLITSSLFGFLCYYDIKTAISWKLTKTNSSSEQSCNLTISMSNSNNQKSYYLRISQNKEETYKKYAWIHRFILFVVLFIFGLISWKNKTKIRSKTSKLKINLYSNDFERQIKLNRKDRILETFLNDQEQS